MKEHQTHYTSEMLQQDIDGALEEGVRAAIAHHLASCRTCRARREELALIDGSLKRLPREHAAPSFTAAVLRQLNLAPSRDLIYPLLKHAGTLFAFLLVSAVVITVVVLSGVLDTAGGEGGGEVQGLLTPMGDALSGIGLLAAKFGTYFGSQSGVALFMFGVIVVGFLGVVDFVLKTRSVRH